MSLMKRRTTTERQKAASRANGRCSHGPASREGREQIRAANLRHGLYSEAEEMLLPSLGEDPHRLEELRRGAHEQFPHADASEVESLLAVMWRLERLDRKYDELLIEQAMAVREGRMDLADTYAPVFSPRLLSMEECAVRELIRINNRLLKAEAAKRQRPLPGLPENILKTKQKANGAAKP